MERNARYTHSTQAVRAKFLDLVAQGRTVKDAARDAGISRERVYQLRRTDPAFAHAFAEAIEEGIQCLEEEARRRAVDGVEEVIPIFFQGVQVGERRRIVYSDSLLAFLLRARRPEVYRDNSPPVRDEEMAPPSVDISRLTTDELNLLAALRRKAMVTMAEPEGKPGP